MAGERRGGFRREKWSEVDREIEKGRIENEDPGEEGESGKGKGERGGEEMSASNL